jgi:hypothetical protein
MLFDIQSGFPTLFFMGDLRLGRQKGQPREGNSELQWRR